MEARLVNGKFRFRLIWLLGLPMTVAIALVVLDRTWIDRQPMTGIELVSLLVVDAESSVPMPDVIAHSSDTKREPLAKRTSAGGEVAFAHEYDCVISASILRKWRDSKLTHQIELTAPTYKSITVEVEDLRGGKNEGFSLPYPIIVHLAKETSANSSRVTGDKFPETADPDVDSTPVNSSSDSTNPFE